MPTKSKKKTVPKVEAQPRLVRQIDRYLWSDGKTYGVTRMSPDRPATKRHIDPLLVKKFILMKKFDRHVFINPAGLLLDGAVRELACYVRGLDPIYVVVDERDALDMIFQPNFLRAENAPAATALAASEYAKKKGIPAAPVAELFGVSETTVRRVGKAVGVVPELAEPVAKGDVDALTTRRIANLSPGQRREYAKIAKSGGDVKAAFDSKDAKRFARGSLQPDRPAHVPPVGASATELLRAVDASYVRPDARDHEDHIANIKGPLYLRIKEHLRAADASKTN